MSTTAKVRIRQLLDHRLRDFSYLVHGEGPGALLIDPTSANVARELWLLDDLSLELHAILVTDECAESVSAAQQIRNETGAMIVGPRSLGHEVQRTPTNGAILDIDRFRVDVIGTPGVTAGALCFLIEGQLFTGRSLLIRGMCVPEPHRGGSVEQLHASARWLLDHLPDETAVWPRHDFEGIAASTVGEERRLNRFFAEGGSEHLRIFVEAISHQRPRKLDETNSQRAARELFHTSPLCSVPAKPVP